MSAEESVARVKDYFLCYKHYSVWNVSGSQSSLTLLGETLPEYTKLFSRVIRPKAFHSGIVNSALKLSLHWRSQKKWNEAFLPNPLSFSFYRINLSSPECKTWLVHKTVSNCQSYIIGILLRFREYFFSFPLRNLTTCSQFITEEPLWWHLPSSLKRK